MHFDGAFEQLFPIRIRGSKLFAAAFGAAPGQAALVLGGGQRGVELGQQLADALAVLISAARQVGNPFAVDQAGRGEVAHGMQQLVGGFARVMQAGQQDGEVGPVQAGRRTILAAGSDLAAGGTDPAQHFVGGFASGPLVDAGEIGDAQHEQAAAGGRIVVAQCDLELIEEEGAVGQAGQAVQRRFAAHLLKAGSFFRKHRLEAFDHGVHGAGKALQFRGFRYVDTDEAALADRPGLADHGVERALDAA